MIIHLADDGLHESPQNDKNSLQLYVHEVPYESNSLFPGQRQSNYAKIEICAQFGLLYDWLEQVKNWELNKRCNMGNMKSWFLVITSSIGMALLESMMPFCEDLYNRYGCMQREGKIVCFTICISNFHFSLYCHPHLVTAKILKAAISVDYWWN